jgi:hypothetical protein
MGREGAAAPPSGAAAGVARIEQRLRRPSVDKPVGLFIPPKDHDFYRRTGFLWSDPLVHTPKERWHLLGQRPDLDAGA